MNTNNFCNQFCLKRAVLEAHVAALRETISETKYDKVGNFRIKKDNNHIDNEECFAKYWKIASEIE